MPIAPVESKKGEICAMRIGVVADKDDMAALSVPS